MGRLGVEGPRACFLHLVGLGFGSISCSECRLQAFPARAFSGGVLGLEDGGSTMFPTQLLLRKPNIERCICSASGIVLSPTLTFGVPLLIPEMKSR